MKHGVEQESLESFSNDMRHGSSASDDPNKAVLVAYNTIRFIFSVAMILLIMFSLALGVGAASGKYKVTPLLSGSMSPKINTGDAVLLTPVKRDQLKEGDVLAFRDPKAPKDDKRPTIHRIIELKKLDDGRVLVRTKGDANQVADQEGIDKDGNPVMMSIDGQQAWIVNQNFRNLGYVMRKLADPRVWFAVFAGIGLMLIFSSMIQTEDDEDDDVEEVEVVGKAEALEQAENSSEDSVTQGESNKASIIEDGEDRESVDADSRFASKGVETDVLAVDVTGDIKT